MTHAEGEPRLFTLSLDAGDEPVCGRLGEDAPGGPGRGVSEAEVPSKLQSMLVSGL